MRFRARRKPSAWRRYTIMSVLFLFLSLVSLVWSIEQLDRSLRPPFMAMATGIARQMATQAINDALTKRVAEDTEYAKLIVVDKDQAGHVTSAHFNFAEVARIESITTLRVQDALMHLQERTIYVPALQAMGSAVLATLGPSIPLRIEPLGSAQSEVEPVVETAGINQTVHILYLHITAQVIVVVPFITAPVRVETKIPIAYVVFVGNVPQTTMVGTGAPQFSMPAPSPLRGTH
ncbi:sporulation protein YunB [Sulfoacidibacillus ferrooxidans]|uniref:Sporulation protein YunB n=1 Tax=Sulfoacidibacillus ferrooxidans TaxID=2005001 RepID=A0A9X2AC85_9BACL|nr:sporulation protein YunB [Sulfoacidibacillus ferrooxidans]MCI0182035.1 Sporulation protein YunB [Sulfoacidibacillus ferrooxidans]